MSRKWIIDPKTRQAVAERSGGTCEICRERAAVHMHHLTYERAGRELPDDLRHVCLGCHMDQHPDRWLEIAQFDIARRRRWMTEEQCQEEDQHLEEEKYREKQREEQREKQREEDDRIQAEQRESQKSGDSGLSDEDWDQFPQTQTIMRSIGDILREKGVDSIPGEMTYAQMAAERDRQKAALYAKFGEIL